MFFNSRVAKNYAEKVINLNVTSELPEELYDIAKQQARASHEGWRAGKIKQGYVYGPTTNDNPENGPLTNPNLVDFDQLDE